MNNELIENYFKKLNLSNSIGHAFLFSNSNYEDLKLTLEKILNEYIFGGEISIDNNSDVYIIEPEKNVIKKEAIKNLEDQLSTTSQVCNKKAYIIKDCEKLNDFSANSLLKTLEEPSSNIYAFLFTKNIEKVILTIKSRCQIIQADNHKILDVYNLYEADLVNTALSIIQKIEKNGVKSIVYNSDIYKNLEKEDLKSILNIVEYFYKDCLNKINNIDLEYFIGNEDEITEVIKVNDDRKLIQKVLLVNKYLNVLDYNLNINLFINKVLIELGRI